MGLGELEFVREALVTLLQARSAQTWSKELVETINHQDSPPLLHEWIRHLAVAQTIDEFRASLRR